MTELPYSVQQRPDTGMTNGKLGTLLFLAADAMFFGALFSSYVLLRTTGDGWPGVSGELNQWLGEAGILSIVSVAGVFLYAIRKLSVDSFRVAFSMAICFSVLALAFTGIQTVWLLAARALPATNTFIGLFYVFYGLLSLHVVAGIILTVMLIWKKSTSENETRQLQVRAECLALYWQFIAGVWLAAFACFYFG